MIEVYYTDAAPLWDEALFREQLQLVQPGRRTRILQKKEVGDRCRMLAAGLLLREGLMRRGLDYDKLVFREGAHGKPELAAEPPLFFNLSHAGHIAAAAFASQPVGIDVECADRFSRPGWDGVRLMRLASKILTGEELAQLEELEEPAQGSELVRIWTRRESYAKALGRGLAAIWEKSFGETAYCESVLMEDCWMSVCTLREREAVRIERVDVNRSN